MQCLWATQINQQLFQKIKEQTQNTILKDFQNLHPYKDQKVYRSQENQSQSEINLENWHKGQQVQRKK